MTANVPSNELGPTAIPETVCATVNRASTKIMSSRYHAALSMTRRRLVGLPLPIRPRQTIEPATRNLRPAAKLFSEPFTSAGARTTTLEMCATAAMYHALGLWGPCTDWERTTSDVNTRTKTGAR